MVEVQDDNGVVVYPGRTDLGRELSEWGANYSMLKTPEFDGKIVFETREERKGEILEDRRSPTQKVIANEIVKNSVGLVYNVVEKLRSKGGAYVGPNDISVNGRSNMDFDDMRQEAVLAILSGLQGYDVNKGALSTQIGFRVAGHVHRKSLEFGLGNIKIPEHVAGNISKLYGENFNESEMINGLYELLWHPQNKRETYRMATAVYEWMSGSLPFEERPEYWKEEGYRRERKGEVSSAVEDLGEIDFEEQRGIWRREAERPRSGLDFNFNFSEMEELAVDETNGDSLYVDGGINCLYEMEDDLIGGIDNETVRLGIGDIVDGLTPREQIILRKRYGLGREKEHDFVEISTEIGLSWERVRQLEARALKRIRETGAAQKLYPVLYLE